MVYKSSGTISRFILSLADCIMLYFETIENTIYDTNFQFSGNGSSSTGVETDSVNINAEFVYEIGIENTTATLVLIFRSKETQEKIGSYAKYKYFGDYCRFFDTGNLYFANYTNINHLHRGIQLRYHNRDTNDDIENFTEYNTLADEDVLSHSDFNFHINKSEIFYEEQIIELYYKVLPFFRQLFFKDKLDFFSRPIGREKKSKQPGGKPARVVCTPVIDVAA
jgi:hypothetical protein